MRNNGNAGSRFSKWTKVSLTLALLVGLLSACTGGSGTSDAENRVLRIGVLYGGSDNEPYFRQQYTDMFEMQNPNISFEIVGAMSYDDHRFQQPDNPDKPQEQPDPYEKMKEMMTGQNPVDVVVLDYNMLRRFTQDNLLQPLDPMIKQDKFDLSDYVPTVIDGIKSAGDNNIFALTPTFTSAALYYNKKIFADLGVEPPTDMMQWQDVFNKARQVASGEGADRKFGFSFNRWNSDAFSDSQTYARSLQLKTFDEAGKKMLVNSDQWEQVWNTVRDLHKEEVVPNQEFMTKMYEKMNSEGGNDPFYGDLFLKGQLAMVVNESYYVNEIKRVNDNAGSIKNFEPIDWDVVTVPTDPANPGAASNIGLSQLMGINTKAQNAKDAWEFIKFSNSKEWAKLKSRSNYELVARKEFLKPQAGLNYNIDAFTLLKPLPPTVDEEKIFRENPNAGEAQYVGNEMFQEFLAGKKEAREALAEWETRGNAILEKPIPEGSVGIMPRPMTYNN
ncbi:extracellular solute-binding protein [Paenibacillus sp. GSMTC-2017]|uniref:ABC transporter substrate-binding protein n=1 Tax=Paenibacillus sp. GSMTC-2017 TaxID=2794350 RepID=UPI0018D79264|nr:extracellular solute-binding protein [Paenibacillus sp. GSMTC-2017]MBH5316866.1 extracellular solute-binding protein [Paenibacillus sp. GSMTC-2017]